MGQFVFRQGDHEILAGYDVAMQYFFLVIDRLDATDDSYTFSNLRDYPRNDMHRADIVSTLEKFKIVPPPGYLDAVFANGNNGYLGRTDYGTFELPAPTGTE